MGAPTQAEKNGRSPPSLGQLQSWFRWIITEPRGVAPALARPRREPKPRCLADVAEAPPLARVARLDVYAEAYLLRLAESLGHDFEALRRVLGADAFQKLAADYLVAHPSRFANIGEVGRKLPRFLKTHPLARDLAFLPDLALLEWSLVEAFYSVDTPPLDLGTLATVPEAAWARARLHLDSSARLLRSKWPVDDVWRARHSPPGELSVELEGRPRWLLVYRGNGRGSDELFVERLEPAQHTVLALARRGIRLGEILSRLEDSAPPLLDWFGGWVRSGVIRSISFK